MNKNKQNLEDEKLKFALAGIVGSGCLVPFLAICTIPIWILPAQAVYEFCPPLAFLVALGTVVGIYYYIWRRDYHKRFPDTVNHEPRSHRDPPEDFPGI